MHIFLRKIRFHAKKELLTLPKQNKKKVYHTTRFTQVLVRKFARLSNGAETDLLEVSDEIMGALNFLICVMMRDKENVSGIWDLKEHLLKEYVAPLDTGLSMSRAHYQASIAEDPAKVSSLLRNWAWISNFQLC